VIPSNATHYSFVYIYIYAAHIFGSASHYLGGTFTDETQYYLLYNTQYYIMVFYPYLESFHYF
jgi:hypothetical protein